MPTLNAAGRRFSERNSADPDLSFRQRGCSLNSLVSVPPHFAVFATPPQNADFTLLVKDGLGKMSENVVRALNAHAIVLMRHPVEVVTSRLRGQQLGVMNRADRSVFINAHRELCRQLSIDEQTILQMDELEFESLSWLGENLCYQQLLEQYSPSQCVVYEQLRADPEDTAQRVFDNLGWQMNSQTNRFLDQSRGKRRVWMQKFLQAKSNYYSVYRTSKSYANASEFRLNDIDQQRVMAVVEAFPLSSYWPSHTPTNTLPRLDIDTTETLAFA